MFEGLFDVWMKYVYLGWQHPHNMNKDRGMIMDEKERRMNLFMIQIFGSQHTNVYEGTDDWWIVDNNITYINNMNDNLMIMKIDSFAWNTIWWKHWHEMWSLPPSLSLSICLSLYINIYLFIYLYVYLNIYFFLSPSQKTCDNSKLSNWKNVFYLKTWLGRYWTKGFYDL